MSGLKLKKAERKRVFAKIGVTAPSGCGKTFSSLLIARGLSSSWERICLIDTEGSGDKYAGHKSLGPYQVINLFESDDQNRFAPQRWIDAMEVVAKAGMEVVILDSATHEWHWCLEQKERINKSINDWKSITPHHTKFINCIVHCPMHVIVCTRRKVEYTLTQDRKVEKLGMKSEMREGFEYELDVNIGLNRSHMATIEKDRAGIFHDRPEFVPTEATGRELLAWSRAEEEKPETDPKAAATDAPISVQNPKTQAWLRQQLTAMNVPENLWAAIMSAVDGVSRRKAGATLYQAIAEAVGKSNETEEVMP